MQLKVFTPAAVALDTAVNKVVGEGPSGAFALLPRHVDLAMALAPGLLQYTDPGGAERYLAVNGGILVKQGPLVQVATRAAVAGELGHLRAAVRRFLEEVDEREKKARAAVARLEADFVKRLMEFGRHGAI